MQNLLEVRNLTVRFTTASGEFTAVEGIDITIDEGEILAIVGESGSGKSVSMMAVMDLLPWTATVTADMMNFRGHDLLTMSLKERRKLYGGEMSMIFQDPMSTLNPCFTVGAQIGETLRQHIGGTRKERRDRTLELLEQVGIPDPKARIDVYPHQLSGGMSQRIIIAMALACNPKLLIADEPTTALDVTIQAQILELLQKLQQERDMGLILITHDMGVVAEVADRVAVQYAGWRVEMQGVKDLFDAPRHPYTKALLSALPERSTGSGRLPTIPGIVPGQHDRPTGCLFSPRCADARDECTSLKPKPAEDDPSATRCFFPLSSNASVSS